MTNEGAITKLRSILTEATEFEDSVCYVTEDDAEALKMAIDLIERYERFKKRAEVVISMLRADRDRLEDAIEKIRSEIAEYGSIWVQYTIKGTTSKDIEDIVENTIKQAKDQVLYIIDKHTKESEES